MGPITSFFFSTSSSSLIGTCHPFKSTEMHRGFSKWAERKKQTKCNCFILGPGATCTRLIAIRNEQNTCPGSIQIVSNERAASVGNISRFKKLSHKLYSTVVTHRLGRKNHSLGHHFSRFSPHWVTFLSNQFHFIMPKLKVQKVKVPIFFGLDG